MIAHSIRPPNDWRTGSKLIASLFAGGVFISAGSAHATSYQQTNLVTDDQSILTGLGYAPAEHIDPNLVNPWGISYGGTGPFWVSDNGNGLSTLYNGSGVPQSLVVTIPLATGGPSAPTGQVFNSGGMSDFVINSGAKASFIFATENGTISAWNAAQGTTAFLEVDNSSSGAVYKGLALANNGVGNFLYAANFNSGKIDVFDHNFTPTTLSGTFTDPSLPAGYAPFNVQLLNGNLYVTYALQDGAKHDDVPGLGHGFVDEYDLNGNLLARVASAGDLDSPWGLDIAPSGFGAFANDLLVGNFGDGTIDVYNPTTDLFLGELNDASGNPIVIDGLWALINGNGGSGGDLNSVYFSAGINGESDGLFGSLSVVPEPASLAIFGAALAGLGVLRRRKRA